MQSNVTNMLAAIALSVGLAAPSPAAITFNEAVNGDASDDPTAPTNLGSLGFGLSTITGPLGPGTYTLWLMELDQFRAYDWSFELRVVPAPSTAAVLLGAGVLASRRRR